MKIKVDSEIGVLKKVLVHRPGKEVERLYPELFERLLFDDIMFLEKAREEHDYFTDKLRKENIDVLYIEKLVAETLDLDPKIREEFINKFVEQANIDNETIKKAVLEYYQSFTNNYELVNATISGVTKRELKPHFSNSIVDIVKSEDNYPIYVDPIPNILFQRDPIASVFNKFNIHNMWSKTRKREAIYYEFLLKYHPEFKDIETLMTPKDIGKIEGGDILVLNKETIFIGISQRTSARAVQTISHRMLSEFEDLQHVVAIKIPESHATMHLDTVLTQIDADKFLINFDMAKLEYQYFVISREETQAKKGMIKFILEKYAHPNIKLFIVGGNDVIRAKREQWNDGANCLAIAPNKIVVYDRNKITNSLIKHGDVEVIEIKSSELSRGRGGPRCMTMPLYREDLS